jgi:hypothetical protein
LTLAPRLAGARDVLLAACLALAGGSAQAEERRDMALAGFHDLSGRGAYQPVIEQQGGRWIAYVGHHAGSAVNPLNGRTEANGTSVLDVSDARKIRLLAHIPGDGAGAQMARVCSGLPGAERHRSFLLRSMGNAAHEVWDVTQPEKPQRVSVPASGLSGTHKSWWECDTGIAYLVSGVPGWRTWRMTQIFDLSNPARPVFVRNFGLPGQEPGSTGHVPTSLHGPVSTGPRGKRVYFGYGVNAYGVLQIVDRDKLLKGPKEPTERNLRHPHIGQLDLQRNQGAHTAFPILGIEIPEFAKHSEGRVRDFVLVVSESLAEGCNEARQMAWMVDVSDEPRPFPVAALTPEEATGNYCSRPGRFGAHASNESFAPVFYRRLVFIAHFNAGVRVFDIRNPYAPREVAYYVPDARGGTLATNNVETDARGHIYMVDRGGLGMHVLELTGAARKIANLQ